MTPEHEAKLRRLREDFLYYTNLMKIRPKVGGLPIVLHLNRAQQYLHQRIEGQKRTSGKVRALILKGRQQGASTYIEARFFHRVATSRGVSAFILTHEQDATDNLFGMAQTYYRNLPEDLRPHLGTSNEKELVFDRLGSGYRVATAGKKDTGRSATAQLFHGSEVAFWPNADSHMAAAGQIVPSADGSEIVLESTANGVGNVFHELWQKAEAGASEYMPIFTPWHWSDEYRSPLPEGYAFSSDDLEYKALYHIEDTQLYWRRLKIDTDFRGQEELFQQEYPATAAEAFINLGHNPFIPVQHVLRSRKAEAEPYGARILGVDPARYGGARSALVYRQGRKVTKMDTYVGIGTMELVGIVARELSAGNADKCFVDVVGLGAGVVDRLHELGFTEIVVGVNAGSQATDVKRYLNKRAEMWDEMRQWFESGIVQIPDSDELQADIVGPKNIHQSTQRLKIESKEDMMKRDVRSPDLADALALTFAFPVSEVFDRSLPMLLGARAPRRIARRTRDWRTR